MLQENFDFFFSRPKTYFGSFQQFEATDASLDWEEVPYFTFEINSQFFQNAKTGIFLNWIH